MDGDGTVDGNGSLPADGRPGHGSDQAEEVALVAQAARRRLLNVHRHLLRFEDLEDCYSQATCELVAQARSGVLRCCSRAHLTNTLQLRFASRVADRRRALRGRSQSRSLLDDAIPLGLMGDGSLQLADPTADVERRAMLRFDLRCLERAADALTLDQQLVLACRIGLQMKPAEFCRRFGWSEEKCRKVTQRARARLRLALEEAGLDRARGEAGALEETEEVSGAASLSGALAQPAGDSREKFFAAECPGLPSASEERAGTHL